MKEQSITLNGFTKGLRQYSDASRNSEGLVECFNLIPRPQGLIAAPTISRLITQVSVDHPFPQVFIGHVHWVCATRDKIYTVNGDWSLTLQLDLNVYYNSFPDAPQGVWHFADFFNYVVLTNGGITVLYNPVAARWEYNDVATIPTLGTILNFNGQMVGSGRATIAGDPKTIHPDASEVDENFLIWGKIGSASFRLDQSNVTGYRPMPWFGEIYKILPLGSGIAVYGSNGISFLEPVDVKWHLKRTLRYGILSREAVSGDETRHVAIDVEGNLRIITPDNLDPEPLYSEFFSGMIGTTVVVTYNPQQRECYVANGNEAYCLTRMGLAEVSQSPTTLAVLGGVVSGFYTDLSDSEARVTSDQYDFGSRGKKTIDGISVGAITSAALYVAIDYRNSSTTSFESTDWVEVNEQGVAHIVVSGLEFRFKIKCSSYSGMKLDYFSPNVKFDDKRFMRGIHVNKAAA